MPSGAKKRKAAKKKLRKETHNNGAHSQGSDDPKPHDHRESDGGEVEREPSEEGAKETSLGEENVAEIASEMKADEKFDDVIVVAGDTFRESHKRNASEEDKSSSSSSSEDDEVKVEKEKLGQGSLPEAALSNETHEPAGCGPETTSSENPVNSEVVYSSIDESIPVEETVKEVVSLSQESNLLTVAESIPFESSTTSDLVELQSELNMNEILPLSDKQDNFSSVVDSSSSEPVDVTRRDIEGLSPKYSGVTTVDRDGNYDEFQESEKHNYSEEQPLVSTAPLPVRRTSLMNCCGLFDVLSGGSSR